MHLTKVLERSEPRLCQGDILRDVHWVEYVTEADGRIEVSRVVFPLAIVLTQDCDLEQDSRIRHEDSPTKDKWLISVLMAPLYNVEHVYMGSHLDELGIKMQPVPKRGNTGTFLRNNERPRFHYLEFDQGIPIVPSLIDFKHYFSATVLYLTDLKKTAFVCSVAPLFREDIAHRFAAYLARVGLPSLGMPVAQTLNSRNPGPVHHLTED